MSPRPLLLATSLVANAVLAALAALVLLRPPAPARPAPAAPVVPVASHGAARETPATAAADMASAAKDGDWMRLRDLLLKAGVAQATVDTIMRHVVSDHYNARIFALAPKRTRMWWNPAAHSAASSDEIRALKAEMEAKLEKLDMGTFSSARLVLHDHLPPEKAMALLRIEDDYRELLNANMTVDRWLLRTPEQTKREELLKKEKERDIAALLTPEELHEHELRHSPLARQLQFHLGTIDPTEKEYRLVFDFERSLQDLPHQEREARKKQLEPALKASLGEERYEEYTLANHDEYKALAAAARIYELPAGTARRLFHLGKDVPAAAARIMDDPASSPEQKKAALARLGAEGRQQLYAIAGREAGDTILASHRLNWIKQLESGYAPNP